jgi:cardiolipin synthase
MDGVTDQALDLLISYWPTVAGAFGVLAATLAAGHAMLHKRDAKAVAGWIGIIFFAPIIGPTLYLLLGINRIQRRAASMRDRLPPKKSELVLPAALTETLGEAKHLEALARFTSREMRRPLTDGNDVEMLVNGEQAYPAMLAAIDGAKHSISLCTYIFDDDEVGRTFVDALARAHERGVQVRVLIDAVGARYSWPRPITRALNKRGVRVARFLPTLLPWRMTYAQLRLHKKTLVVDGHDGFTGGMNIRVGHDLEKKPSRPVQDLHFRLAGPVVEQLQASFAEDWEFTTGERLGGEAWFPTTGRRGALWARAITDGPDEDLEHLRWTYIGGLACAQKSVKIVTPYFLPDGQLISALNSAAMRGVDVEILLPERCNLSLPQWASRATVWQILQRGCRIWLTPEPFDHTKLMIVDDSWTLFGSGNWDPRSYRLCFELVVEAYGSALADPAAQLFAAKKASAKELTYEDVESRPLPVKLRDGAVRALSPYL